MKRRILQYIHFTLIFTIQCCIPPHDVFAQAQGFMPNLRLRGNVNVSNITHNTDLRGVKVFLDNPQKLLFLVNFSEDITNTDDHIREASKLVKYFMAALTIPNDELWVNLSPQERHRIISEKFSKTQMGHDLLSQDYWLKLISSSLLSPEQDLGIQFWEDFYSNHNPSLEYDIPLNLFNRVWIIPDQATIYTHGSVAYLKDSHLKVMFEDDYFRLQGKTVDKSYKPSNFEQIILPQIEKMVNESPHFAIVRQCYQAMILATWYKRHLKNSFLGQIYVDNAKMSGIDDIDSNAKIEIFEKYLSSFDNGVFELIKEDYDPQTQSILTRKYFSGGTAYDPSVVFEQKVGESTMRQQTDGLTAVEANLDPQLKNPNSMVLNPVTEQQQEIIETVSLFEKMVVGFLITKESDYDIYKGQTANLFRNVINHSFDLDIETVRFVLKLINHRLSNQTEAISLEAANFITWSLLNFVEKSLGMTPSMIEEEMQYRQDQKEGKLSSDCHMCTEGTNSADQLASQLEDDDIKILWKDFESTDDIKQLEKFKNILSTVFFVNPLLKDEAHEKGLGSTKEKILTVFDAMKWASLGRNSLFEYEFREFQSLQLLLDDEHDPQRLSNIVNHMQTVLKNVKDLQKVDRNFIEKLVNDLFKNQLLNNKQKNDLASLIVMMLDLNKDFDGIRALNAISMNEIIDLMAWLYDSRLFRDTKFEYMGLIKLTQYGAKYLSLTQMIYENNKQKFPKRIFHEKRFFSTSDLLMDILETAKPGQDQSSVLDLILTLQESFDWTFEIKDQQQFMKIYAILKNKKNDEETVSKFIDEIFLRDEKFFEWLYEAVLDDDEMVNVVVERIIAFVAKKSEISDTFFHSYLNLALKMINSSMYDFYKRSRLKEFKASLNGLMPEHYELDMAFYKEFMRNVSLTKDVRLQVVVNEFLTYFINYYYYDDSFQQQADIFTQDLLMYSITLLEDSLQEDRDGLIGLLGLILHLGRSIDQKSENFLSFLNDEHLRLFFNILMKTNSWDQDDENDEYDKAVFKEVLENIQKDMSFVLNHSDDTSVDILLEAFKVSYDSSQDSHSLKQVLKGYIGYQPERVKKFLAYLVELDHQGETSFVDDMIDEVVLSSFEGVDTYYWFNLKEFYFDYYKNINQFFSGTNTFFKEIIEHLQRGNGSKNLKALHLLTYKSYSSQYVTFHKKDYLRPFDSTIEASTHTLHMYFRLPFEIIRDFNYSRLAKSDQDSSEDNIREIFYHITKQMYFELLNQADESLWNEYLSIIDIFYRVISGRDAASVDWFTRKDMENDIWDVITRMPSVIHDLSKYGFIGSTGTTPDLISLSYDKWEARVNLEEEKEYLSEIFPSNYSDIYSFLKKYQWKYLSRKKFLERFGNELGLVFAKADLSEEQKTALQKHLGLQHDPRFSAQENMTCWDCVLSHNPRMADKDSDIPFDDKEQYLKEFVDTLIHRGYWDSQSSDGFQNKIDSLLRVTNIVGYQSLLNIFPVVLGDTDLQDVWIDILHILVQDLDDGQIKNLDFIEIAKKIKDFYENSFPNKNKTEEFLQLLDFLKNFFGAEFLSYLDNLNKIASFAQDSSFKVFFQELPNFRSQILTPDDLNTDDFFSVGGTLVMAYRPTVGWDFRIDNIETSWNLAKAILEKGPNDLTAVLESQLVSGIYAGSFMINTEEVINVLKKHLLNDSSDWNQPRFRNLMITAIYTVGVLSNDPSLATQIRQFMNLVGIDENSHFFVKEGLRILDLKKLRDTVPSYWSMFLIDEILKAYSKYDNKDLKALFGDKQGVDLHIHIEDEILGQLDKHNGKPYLIPPKKDDVDMGFYRVLNMDALENYLKEGHKISKSDMAINRNLEYSYIGVTKEKALGYAEADGFIVWFPAQSYNLRSLKSKVKLAHRSEYWRELVLDDDISRDELRIYFLSENKFKKQETRNVLRGQENVSILRQTSDGFEYFNDGYDGPFQLISDDNHLQSLIRRHKNINSRRLIVVLNGDRQSNVKNLFKKTVSNHPVFQEEFQDTQQNDMDDYTKRAYLMQYIENHPELLKIYFQRKAQEKSNKIDSINENKRGSQPGADLIIDGERYYAKFYEEEGRLRSEFLTWMIYKELQIPTLEERYVMKIKFKGEDRWAIVSRWEDTDESIDVNSMSLQQRARNYVASVYTQDRDQGVKRNTLRANGKIKTADYGGANIYRSTGGIKGVARSEKDNKEELRLPFSFENFLEMLSLYSEQRHKPLFMPLVDNQKAVDEAIQYTANHLTEKNVSRLIQAASFQDQAVANLISNVYRLSLRELNQQSYSQIQSQETLEFLTKSPKEVRKIFMNVHNSVDELWQEYRQRIETLGGLNAIYGVQSNRSSVDKLLGKVDLSTHHQDVLVGLDLQSAQETVFFDSISVPLLLRLSAAFHDTGKFVEYEKDSNRLNEIITLVDVDTVKTRNNAQWETFITLMKNVKMSDTIDPYLHEELSKILMDLYAPVLGITNPIELTLAREILNKDVFGRLSENQKYGIWKNFSNEQIDDQLQTSSFLTWAFPNMGRWTLLRNIWELSKTLFIADTKISTGLRHKALDQENGQWRISKTKMPRVEEYEQHINQEYERERALISFLRYSEDSSNNKLESITKREIRLVVIDFDDTVSRRGYAIIPKLLEAMKSLLESGVKVIIVSGTSTERIMRKLDYDQMSSTMKENLIIRSRYGFKRMHRKNSVEFSSMDNESQDEIYANMKISFGNKLKRVKKKKQRYLKVDIDENQVPDITAFVAALEKRKDLIGENKLFLTRGNRLHITHRDKGDAIIEEIDDLAIELGVSKSEIFRQTVIMGDEAGPFGSDLAMSKSAQGEALFVNLGERYPHQEGGLFLTLVRRYDEGALAVMSSITNGVLDLADVLEKTQAAALKEAKEWKKRKRKLATAKKDRSLEEELLNFVRPTGGINLDEDLLDLRIEGNTFTYELFDATPYLKVEDIFGFKPFVRIVPLSYKQLFQ